MSICCDTSFLFSLYINDAHTAKALAEVTRIGRAIHISVLNRYELENALGLAAFRKILSTADVLSTLADFESDVATGRLILVSCNLASVIAEARRLSARHTLKQGYRAFDILQMGAALTLRAGVFLSFDERQRKLAKAEGLQVKP
jgi:predicted nucleic acid-binding protein